MKKIAIVVAVLLFAAPAMAKVTAGATVDVNLSADPCNLVVTMDGEIEVTVEYSANAKPRAFALDLIVDSKGKIKRVKDFHKGVSKKGPGSRGFGIFPASFNRFIDADDPNWSEPNYTPVALPGDLPSDTQGGIDTNGVTIEMGSLYEGGPNAPNDTGTLFNIYVSCWDPCEGQTGDANLAIALNVGRGKVVLEDGNEPNTVTYPGNSPGRHIQTPFDWGDAPDNAGVPVYPTLFANNGARHVMVNNAKVGTLCLGTAIDPEGNGQPANQDDALGATPDDEEGVTNLLVIIPQGTVDVFVTTPAGVLGGWLNAWIDFNIDGDWDDAGEQIFNGQWLNTGANNGLTFPVPLTATANLPTWSRWRMGTRINLGVRGATKNGEVEDYYITDGVICHVPDVVGDPNATAQATIIAAGFTVNIVAECNDTIEAGIVIRTDPVYCTYPDCGTTVDIYVSTGPCGGCGTCPLDITGWEGIPDGYVGPEDVLYMKTLVNGCAYQYCAVGGLTAAEACLDVTGWEGIPDGYVGPEDVLYIKTQVNGCAYQYCPCP